MTEYQYDLLYFCSEFVSIIFQVGVLILGINYLKIKKRRKEMSLHDQVAQFVMDSPECKKEIIWLLKKCFKDDNELSEMYTDVLNTIEGEKR